MASSTSCVAAAFVRLVLQASAADKLQFSAELHNRGDRDGSEIVFAWSMPHESELQLSADEMQSAGLLPLPFKTVVGFKQLWLRANSSRSVVLTMHARELALVDGEGERIAPRVGSKLKVVIDRGAASSETVSHIIDVI